MAHIVPQDWMPSADMKRIHVHWTAGAHKANSVDQNAYHILVEGDGDLVRGKRPINANEKGSGMKQASHTLRANTGAIGVSMCCMAGARERPFHAGHHPLTHEQWDKMVQVVADLAEEYDIMVTPVTILTHAEVEPNLHIKQKNKWDIVRLAFDGEIVGAREVGDHLRTQVAELLDDPKDEDAPIPEEMKLPRFRVSGVHPSTLNFRDGPNGVKKGSLPERTVVERLAVIGEWWMVRTRLGFVGWVFSSFLKPA